MLFQQQQTATLKQQSLYQQQQYYNTQIRSPILRFTALFYDSQPYSTIRNPIPRFAILFYNSQSFSIKHRTSIQLFKNSFEPRYQNYLFSTLSTNTTNKSLRRIQTTLKVLFDDIKGTEALCKEYREAQSQYCYSFSHWVLMRTGKLVITRGRVTLEGGQL